MTPLPETPRHPLAQAVIDTHLHLDDRIDGTAAGAVRQLEQDLAASGVARGLVLHLQAQPWSVEEFSEAVAASSRLAALINLHPGDAECEQQLRRGIEQLGFVGLKLHPRLQQFALDDPRTEKLVRMAGEMAVPVLVDAFPDGDALMAGFSPLAYARLARNCPQTRLILAHFGGHCCIDFMMLAKRLPNIYFDLSYSLLYYRGAGVVQDLVYCCRSMRFNRIFYGSDYPDRSIEASLDGTLVELARYGVTDLEQRQLLYENAKEFFQWNDI